MESELFGHEKGAFTGAVSRRHGCFELANTGTLLLDEIGEMPSLLQAKLLRVIEERVLHRLGSRKEIPVDVRILAATNKDPHDAVRGATLREDLLYRLNVITIHMPLLAERLEDLPLLAQHLVTRLAAKHNRPARFLSPAALDALRFHSWPGNVRELRNVIERAVVISSGEQIERHHFAPYPFDLKLALCVFRMLFIAPVSVLLFFIDGLGIGTRGPHNPFDDLPDADPLAIFQDEEPRIPFGGVLTPTDACLGVEGRPQSASGQTTILTGINAPATVGYHKQGFPNQALLDIIREHSLFVQLKRAGVSPITFANTYTKPFFQVRPRWISVTTAAVEAAGLRFNQVEDLRAGAAVFHDFTNELLIERGESVDLRSPEEAGAVLASIAGSNRVTLYEYFITDKISPAQDP